MMRLGLIGLGKWGQRYIDRVGSRDDCRIVAVARRTQTSAHGIPGVESCADWQSLVELATRGGLDGVIAATKPEHQAEVAVACARAGVPLLVEKPLGLSARAALDVHREFEASAAKPPIVVDYIHLWAPAFVALRARARAAIRLSDIATITSCGWNRGPFRSFSPVFDYGSHDLAMILSLVGVDAPLLSISHEYLPTDTTAGQLHAFQLQLGAVSVHMRVGNGASVKARSFAVRLRDGREWVYDDQLEQPHKLVENGTPIAVDTTGPLDLVVEDFVQRIRVWKAGRWSATVTGADLALSVRINGILEQLST